MTPRILVNGQALADQPQGARLALDADRSHYLLRVLRLRVGEPLQVFDGSGLRREARLIEILRDRAVLALGEARAAMPPSPVRARLVQGISAAEKMDFTIEKAVELGVAAIAPVQTDRGQVRLDADRAQKRLAHWQRLIEAACMQCGQDHLPAIDAPVSLKHWLAGRDRSIPGWVLDPSATISLASALPASLTSPRTDQPSDDCVAVDLLVGPESGLSPEEINMAQQAGLHPVKLGPRVLRTETAGLAALTLLQGLIGDLR